MIWLLPHLSPLSLQQVVSLSQYSCVSPVEHTGGRRGEDVGEEPNHKMARKPGLYESFNTPWAPARLQ